MTGTAEARARNPRLAGDEIERFRRDGYLQINRPLFDGGRFDALKSLFEQLLAARGPDALDVPHFHEPQLLDYLLSDAVLDVVEPLIGPDIGLWSSHFISKPAHVGPATPWHEDGAYWRDRISTMDGVVTVWLALDPADRANGSMAVIPGTHDGRRFDYETVALTGEVFDRQIVADQIDTATAAFADLRPNEFTLHDARIVHGAEANRSPSRRAGYTMRYFPTTSRIDPAANGDHQVWLARGRDRAGNRYANG